MPGNKPGYLLDRKAYDVTSPEETKLKVSLWDQKVWLLDREGRAVLESDVATGVPGHETPVGNFPVLERLESKRSNQYGQLVDEKSGRVLVKKAWEHEGPIPEGAVYEGISMPYWMRLTWDGVGMHIGEFNKRARSSFGCIRVYEKAQPMIFAKTRLGTEVEIVSRSLIPEYGM